MFLAQGSPKKRDSRAGLWVQAPAKPHLGLGLRPRDMPSPICGLLVQLRWGVI